MRPPEYRDMIKNFLDGGISAQKFKLLYINTFKKEETDWGEELFWILQTVFESADAYWHECKPEEETPFEISEPTFRKEVAESFAKLEKYLSDHAAEFLAEPVGKVK